MMPCVVDLRCVESNMLRKYGAPLSEFKHDDSGGPDASSMLASESASEHEREQLGSSPSDTSTYELPSLLPFPCCESACPVLKVDERIQSASVPEHVGKEFGLSDPASLFCFATGFDSALHCATAFLKWLNSDAEELAHWKHCVGYEAISCQSDSEKL